MSTSVRFARVLKLALLCFVCIFIVSSCFDDNPTSSINSEKLTVYIGSNACTFHNDYEIFVNDVSIGKLTMPASLSTMEEWINNNNECPLGPDSVHLVPPYLIHQITPGVIRIRTKNLEDRENFDQEFNVNKNHTIIFLDYKTIEKPSELPDPPPPDSLTY